MSPAIGWRPTVSRVDPASRPLTAGTADPCDKQTQKRDGWMDLPWKAISAAMGLNGLLKLLRFVTAVSVLKLYILKWKHILKLSFQLSKSSEIYYTQGNALVKLSACRKKPLVYKKNVFRVQISF